MTDAQMLINLAFTAAGCLLGFILNSLRTSVMAMQTTDTQLAEKVQKIEVLVAGKYLTVDQYSKDRDAMFAQLRRIEDKLDEAPCKVHGHGRSDDACKK